MLCLSFFDCLVAQKRSLKKGWVLNDLIEALAVLEVIYLTPACQGIGNHHI